MVEASQQNNQLINTLAQWTNDAPLCTCRKQNIAYFCLQKDCALNKQQMLYCQECLQEGSHLHKHTQIRNVLGDIREKWEKIKESSEILCHKVTRIYEEWSPMITYLENAMSQVQLLPLGFKWITQDQEGLLKFQKRVIAASGEVEEFIKGRRIE